MLTPKMLQLYRVMEAYKARNGVMPSYQEMADMMGINSTSGIQRLILGLEERGALVRLPNRARAIALRPLP